MDSFRIEPADGPHIPNKTAIATGDRDNDVDQMLGTHFDPGTVDLMSLGTLQGLGTEHVYQRNGATPPVLVNLIAITIKDLQPDKTTFVQQALQFVMTVRPAGANNHLHRRRGEMAGAAGGLLQCSLFRPVGFNEISNTTGNQRNHGRSQPKPDGQHPVQLARGFWQRAAHVSFSLQALEHFDFVFEVPTHPVHCKLVHHRVLRELGPLDIHFDRVPIDTALAGDMVFQWDGRLGAGALS